jgi:uncharacterized damage-inducible protein DinB
MYNDFMREFTDRWKHVNAMTIEFVGVVPDEAWDASPLEGFAPFSKQLRHVVCVRGVYNEGLRTGSVDFRRKHEYHEGLLTRASLVEALDCKHAELLALLSDLPEDLFRPQVDFYGSLVSTAQYLYGYIQHEAIHHGQWSLYAAAAGYETPALWRLQWGLAAGAT